MKKIILYVLITLPLLAFWPFTSDEPVKPKAQISNQRLYAHTKWDKLTEEEKQKRHWKKYWVERCGKQMLRAFGKDKKGRRGGGTTELEFDELRIKIRMSAYHVDMEFKKNGRWKRFRVNNRRCMTYFYFKNVPTVHIIP